MTATTTLDAPCQMNMDAYELSFDFNSFDPKSGKILSREAKKELRRKLGYCTTCPGAPVMLYISPSRKSRLNPFAAKQPRTAPGECRDGICLKCSSSSGPGDKRRSSVHSSATTSTSSSNLRDMRQSSLGQQQNYHNHHHHQQPPTASILLSSSNDSVHSFRTDDSAGTTDYVLSRSVMRRESSSSNSHHHNYSHLSRNTPRTNSNDSLRDLTQDCSLYPLQTSPSERNLRSTPLARTIPLRSRSEHHAPISGRPRMVRRPPVRQLSSSTTGSDDMSHTNCYINYNGNSSRSVATGISMGGESHDGSTRSIFSNIGESMRSIMEIPNRNDFDDSLCDELTPPASPMSSTTSNFPPSSRGSRSSDVSTGDNSSATMDGLDALIQDMVHGESYEALMDLLVTTMTIEKDNAKTQLMCIETTVNVLGKNKGTSNSEAHKAVLLSDIYVCVLSAMRNFKDSVHVQASACQVITHISSTEGGGSQQVRRQLLNADVLETLGSTLNTHFGDANVVLHAMTALRSLSLEGDVRERMRHIKLSEKELVQAMQCHIAHVGIQRDGCAVLSNVAIDDENSEPQTVTSEILEVIVNALEKHKRNTIVTTSACFALKNLSLKADNARQMLVLFENLELLQELQDSNEDAADLFEVLMLLQIEQQSMEEYSLSKLQSLETVQNPKMIVSAIVEILDSSSTSTKLVKTALMFLSTRVSDDDVANETFDEETMNKLMTYLRRSSNDIEARQYAGDLIRRFQSVLVK